MPGKSWTTASDGLSQTDRIQTFEETAGTLEGLSEPDYPKFQEFKDSKVVLLPDRSHRTGRAHRCACAVGDLRVCSDALESLLETIEEYTGPICGEPKKECVAALEELKNTVDEAANECDNLEFPGMYG